MVTGAQEIGGVKLEVCWAPNPWEAAGQESVIERAIVDKNARVGRGVRIVNSAGDSHKDGDGFFIRDGIVIVPKGGVVPDGTVI